MPLSTTAAQPSGLSRRDFVKVCTAAAAAVGMPAWAGEKMAEKVAKGHKPSVVWLHFQECTGCTESLLRTSDRKSTRLNSSHVEISYAVFCLKKKKNKEKKQYKKMKKEKEKS